MRVPSLGRRGTSALLAPVVAVAVLAGCTEAPDQGSSGQSSAARSSTQPGSATSSSADVATVASDLEAPWSIAFDGDTALISERDSGRVLELADDGTSREVGTIDEATPMGEGGLLGIAVYEGFLYAYFTAGDENRLERYELTGEPGSLGLGESATILDGIPAASYHDGGRIAFGPDGMLYVSVGDAGNGQAAQDRGSLSGKILRLTPDGAVPGDNPFDGSPVYSYGHRNPQGIAWDEDGTMYASEFGEDTWDEHLVGEHGRLRDVTVAPDGSLWILTNSTDGRGDPGPDDDRILRLDPTA